MVCQRHVSETLTVAACHVTGPRLAYEAHTAKWDLGICLASTVERVSDPALDCFGEPSYVREPTDVNCIPTPGCTGPPTFTSPLADIRAPTNNGRRWHKR